MISITTVDMPLKKTHHAMVKKCVNAVIQNIKKEITIATCSDKYILEMNKQSLNHDYYTDIITYHYENTAEKIEAELLISLERIEENANTNNVPFENELARIIIHGCLHLIGFDDKTTKLKTEMTQQEDKYLKLIIDEANK